MKPFSYVTPDSLESALDLVGQDWDTRVMAGGTDLLGEMKAGIRSPHQIVHITRLQGVARITREDETLVIGGLVTISQLETDPMVAELLPILTQAAAEVATPQLRNMATVVGNILQRPRCWYYRDPDVHCLRKGGQRCHAVVGDNRYHAILGGGPCHIVCPSDLAPALTCLGASVEISGKGRAAQTVALEDFFVGPRTDPHNENTLGPGDIITAVRVPIPQGKTAGAFLKSRERKVWDFALSSVAVQIQWEGGGVRAASIVLGGVAPNPWIAREAAHSLVGESLSPELCETAADLSVKEARPLKDNAYKVDLTRNLVRRALVSLIP